MSERLILTNSVSEIQRLLEAVAEFGKANQLSDHIIYELKLALEEVVSNIINYGFEDEAEHQIEVQMSIEEESLSFEVTDDGRPFNPLKNTGADIEKPFEEWEIGGLGIHLIRRLMDELEYKSAKGKNILIMKRRTYGSVG